MKASGPRGSLVPGSFIAGRAASWRWCYRAAHDYYLTEDNILADDNGVSVLKHVKRTKIDDDVRQPLSADDLDRLIAAAGRPAAGTER